MGTLSADGLNPTQALLSVLNISHEFAYSDVPHESPTDIGTAFAGSLKYTVNLLTGSTLLP